MLLKLKIKESHIIIINIINKLFINNKEINKLNDSINNIKKMNEIFKIDQ